MPTYAQTFALIEGDEADIAAVRESIKLDENRLILKARVEPAELNVDLTQETQPLIFDFNHLVPLPEDLENHSSTPRIVASHEYNDYVQRYGEYDVITVNDANWLEETYGANNWFDWRCKNWGTKAEAREAQVYADEPHRLVLSFTNPWVAPVEYFDAITEKYNLTITAGVIYETEGFEVVYGNEEHFADNFNISEVPAEEEVVDLLSGRVYLDETTNYLISFIG